MAEGQSGNSLSIQMKHIFGCKADITNAIFQIDEHRIIYPAGHNVVVYHNDDQPMEFYQAHEGSFGITAMTVCPTRRFLAVAERAERAIITVYEITSKNLRKKKTFATSDCLSQEYVSLAFAPRNERKILISLGGASDWTLVYWLWDKPKVLFTAKVSSGPAVYQVSFNPIDYKNGIIVTGENIFGWYKENDTLKPQAQAIGKKPAEASSVYIFHTWLTEGKLIVATDSGHILICDQNCDCQKSIPPNGSWIPCFILPFSNGFLLGGEEARVYIIEKKPDQPQQYNFDNPKSYSLINQPAAKIRGMTLSPISEDNLVLMLDNSQIFVQPLMSDQDEAKSLSSPFHSTAINGLDVCIRKPLIVTCGMDNSVRIWNYEKNKLEVMEYFNGQLGCVAFHPSGFHIVVGFADKVRMMNVFANTIKYYKEIHIKGCKEIKFCNGGHMFACANGHEVHVFNFYTGESPPHMKFKGHSNKVTSLHWNEDDSLLFSAAGDGTVYEWKINSRAEQKDKPDYQAGKDSNSFECIALSPFSEPRTYYVTGKSNDIKEIINNIVKNPEKNETEIKQDIRALETGAKINQIVVTHNGRSLIAGVSESEKPGALRIYKLSPFNGEYEEIQAHSLPILRIRVNFDDTHIFSAGQDGSLIVYEIKDSKSLKKEKENSLPFAEEILITKAEIEELNHEIESLQKSAKDSEISNKFQYDMDLQEKNRRIEELRQQIDQGSKQEKARYESLSKSKKDMENSYEDRLKQIKEAFGREKTDMNKNFNAKLKKEQERLEELEKEKQYKAKEYKERNERLRSENQRILSELEEKYRKQCEEVRLEIERLAKENEDQQKDFEVKRQKLEEQNDRELFNIKQENIKEIETIKLDHQLADSELMLAKKIEERLKDEKNKKADEVKSKDEELENQREKIKTQNNEIKSNEKEILVRKNTIKEKEKRIFELKKKKQELEKFRFVLDYKIRELKKDIGPREDEINNLKEQTSEMEKELKHLQNVNEKLGILVENLRLRQDGMQEEIKKQSEKLMENHSKIQALKDGIYDCVQYIQEEKKLKEAVLKLYEKFVRNETQAKGSTTENQYVRQCEHLERTISGLRKKLSKVKKVHKQDTNRIMSNNVDLISEINGLRKELKNLNYLKSQVEMLQKEKGNKKLVIEDNTKKEIEINKEELMILKRRLNELETGVPSSFQANEEI